MREIVLSWPQPDLSPNARVHWSKLARAKKAYRADCAWQAIAQGAKPIKAERIAVEFTFHPPSKRRIDLDNCIARLKSGIDGLVDVLEVDDSRWDMSFRIADTVGGMVKVVIK
jgi:crossover junction endodeoxyribonuclease RusA